MAVEGGDRRGQGRGAGRQSETLQDSCSRLDIRQHILHSNGMEKLVNTRGSRNRMAFSQYSDSFGKLTFRAAVDVLDAASGAHYDRKPTGR